MAKDLFTPAWFPFYYGKFNSATQLFTAEAIGTYIIMLNYQWDNGGLPNDVDELCVLTKSSLKSVEKVLPKFDLMEDGLLWNVRLEEIREEQHAKYLKSKEKADRANATIRMKKQILPAPSTERTTLHTTERSTSEQRNVNDTQIDVDVDNRLSNDNKEIDTNVSIKKVEAKESRKHNFSQSPFYELSAFEQEFIRLGDIKMPNKEIKPTEIDIEYYWNSAMDYGVDISHKYAHWVIAVRSWIKNAPQRNKQIIYKKVEQLKEIYSNLPPPPKIETKTAEQIHEEAMRHINGYDN
jgi:uncharacterized protein YdaU (DUF1376 family)